MLKQLHIENYAIIENITIDFSDGFSVFSGETGAGKSIIIGALSLLFGSRADSSIISDGKSNCVIEGIFSPSKECLNLLAEIDIKCNDDYFIVRRTINKHNSIIRINEKAVTLSFLQKLFSNEADIHCQHDNQYLLKSQNHLHLLDKYALNDNDLITYQASYKAYKTLKEQYDELLTKNFSEEEYDYWHYCQKELVDANLKLGEEEKLNEIEKRLKEKDKILEAINIALNIYRREGGINDELYDVYHTLKNKEGNLIAIADKVKDYIYLLDEEMDKLLNIKNSFDDDSYDLNTLNERLYLLSRLKRKYNTNEEGLINKLATLNKQIDNYNNKEDILKEKEREIKEEKNKVLKQAKLLHEKRIQASINLEKEISKELIDLLLPNAKFKIAINETQLSDSGNDQVLFLISLNKSEELKPLNKVASGGELSRLMLGLKTIFTKLSGHNIVIFDEIDTGLSGNAAMAVGLKMHKIAKNAQVLGVSHLANVIAAADNNYYIYKEDVNNKTLTRIQLLNEEEKIKEIARINGTVKSIHGLNAAKELLKITKELVNENK